jgi:hypothetical protein
MLTTLFVAAMYNSIGSWALGAAMMGADDRIRLFL